MTTFTHGGWLLLKVAALVSTTALWGLTANANSAQSASSAARTNADLTCPQARTASVNRYTLLMFFSTRIDYQPGIQKVFGSGCVRDPDAAPGAQVDGLIVQGGCPTDCVHPADRIARDNYLPGDPLSHLIIGPEEWGIFFADYGKPGDVHIKDAAPDDGLTTFRVWQVLAKDSCHAGKILKLLIESYSDVFSASGGYLGHIMIGSTTRAAHGSGNGSIDNCAVWNPTVAKRKS